MQRVGISDMNHTSFIGNNGRIVMGVVCPKCDGTVIYNGNYFCSDWGYDTTDDYGITKHYGGSCSWALAHPATSKDDRIICDALGLSYE